MRRSAIMGCTLSQGAVGLRRRGRIRGEELGMSVRAAGVFTVGAVALLAGLLAFFGAQPAPAPVANGFEDEPVADVPGPTALAFTPDGRLLVTSKSGQVWVVGGDGQKTKA